MFKFNQKFSTARLIWQKAEKAPDKGKQAPADKPEAQKKDPRSNNEGLKAAEDLVNALGVVKSEDGFSKAFDNANKNIKKSKINFNQPAPVLETSHQTPDKKGKGVDVKVETPTSDRQPKLKEKSPTFFKKTEGITETGQAKTKLDVGGKIQVDKTKLAPEFITFLNEQAKNEYPNDFLANYGDDKYIVQNNKGEYRVFSAAEAKPAATASKPAKSSNKSG